MEVEEKDAVSFTLWVGVGRMWNGEGWRELKPLFRKVERGLSLLPGLLAQSCILDLPREGGS